MRFIENSIKLYNGKFYWAIWIVWLVGLLLARTQLFYDEESYFNLFIVYMFLNFIGFSIVAMVINRSLTYYLHDHKKDIWDKIIDYSSMFGGGTYNVPNYWEFIFSHQCEDDKNIKIMKNALKHTGILIIVVFFTSPIVFVLLMFPYK